MRISALPVFLKTYIDRLSFSFTGYLRNEKDSRPNCISGSAGITTSFRELELSLILQRS